MKQLDILSIMSIFLILSTVTIGTVSAATSAEEKKQDSRLSALESSVQKITTRLTALEGSVAKILTRLTIVENNPYPAIYYEDYRAKQFYSGMEEINRLTFNLIRPAYVKAETTGWFQFQSSSSGDCAYFGFDIDNTAGAGRTFCNSGTYGEGDYAINRVFYLGAGQHTMYVYGKRILNIDGMLNSGAEITVIASDNGSITNPYVGISAVVNGTKANGIK